MPGVGADLGSGCGSAEGSAVADRASGRMIES